MAHLKWWVRWGDGGMERWGDGEMGTPRNKNLLHSFRRVSPVRLEPEDSVFDGLKPNYKQKYAYTFGN
ncbi:MAG: hypothetical protein F6K23_08975 [Okeania sp. SIO2C9]|uniref:hypothetical protein n=1 Tax=Okeania sp. SIO2C9 TaxID=2607791 RepID=UPI0013C185CA|nr:hypothetical protein [Okeania sp. SIO2C9]NEQ73195.1 hypothetical protein [Okeania sp. SIO2C9]